MNASDHAKAAKLYLEQLCGRIDRGERLVRQRKDWWIGVLGIPLGLPIALGLGAAGLSCTNPSDRGPNDPLQMRDKCSRSRSGAPNCNDPDCVNFCRGIEYGAPLMAQETECRDRADNDGDSLVDCSDPDCAPQCSAPAYAAPPPVGAHEYNCGDGVDDDNDGYTDCSDTDCSPLSVCRGAQYPGPVRRPKETNCTNGIDDDRDGTTDCDDTDCYPSAVCHGIEYAAPMPSPPAALYAAPHM